MVEPATPASIPEQLQVDTEIPTQAVDTDRPFNDEERGQERSSPVKEKVEDAQAVVVAKSEDDAACTV